MSVFRYVTIRWSTSMGDPPDAERSSWSCPRRCSRPPLQGLFQSAGKIVTAVNGMQIHSLTQLVTVLRDLKDEFVTFEFEGHGGEAIVFPRAKSSPRPKTSSPTTTSVRKARRRC